MSRQFHQHDIQGAMPVSLRETFLTDGYVRLERFVDEAMRSDIEQRLTDFIAITMTELPREDVFYEDRSRPESLKQIQRLHLHDEFFGSMMNEGRFPELASQLLDDDVVPRNLQYFNKPPGISLPTPPHQDGYYFMIEPCEAITMWVALDQVDESNGCVRYVRGSHRNGMRTHSRTSTLGFSQGIADFGESPDDENEVAIPAVPGDVLAHHAMTIHRADANQTSNRSRRSLGLVYYAKRARPDENAAAAYQEKLRQEMIDAGRL